MCCCLKPNHCLILILYYPESVTIYKFFTVYCISSRIRPNASGRRTHLHGAVCSMLMFLVCSHRYLPADVSILTTPSTSHHSAKLLMRGFCRNDAPTASVALWRANRPSPILPLSLFHRPPSPIPLFPCDHYLHVYLCARSDCSNERVLGANGKAKARSCTKFYSWCQLSHVTGALAFSATNMASISRSVRRKQAEDGKYMGRVNPRRKITMLLIQTCNE